ncbi:MAG: hypothetical protein DGJ47_000856 [Rickettsiaceae bacterium]
MKKYLILCCVVLFSNISLVNAADSEQKQLEVYVDNLMQKTYDLFQKKGMSDQDRKKASAKLIESHLHFDWMAKYSLGRYRRKLSRSKIQEFTKAYTRFIINSYSELALSYEGEKGVLTKVRRLDEDLFMVNTKIVNTRSGSSLRVDYLIHEQNRGGKKLFLVGDIITEGVSILNSQQSEFKSILSTEGIDALIEDIQVK